MIVDVSSHPLTNDNLELRSNQDEMVSQLIKPILWPEARCKAQLEATHERSKYRTHLVKRQRSTDAVARP
jgi:hypothetical protein